MITIYVLKTKERHKSTANKTGAFIYYRNKTIIHELKNTLED